MVNLVIKGVAASLLASLLFSGCTATTQSVEKDEVKKAQISEVKKVEVSATANEVEIVKEKKKKKKKRFSQKKQKAKSTKFCFKDNRSIHYRASERCK